MFEFEGISPVEISERQIFSFLVSSSKKPPLGFDLYAVVQRNRVRNTKKYTSWNRNGNNNRHPFKYETAFYLIFNNNLSLIDRIFSNYKYNLKQSNEATHLILKLNTSAIALDQPYLTPILKHTQTITLYIKLQAMTLIVDRMLIWKTIALHQPLRR